MLLLRLLCIRLRRSVRSKDEEAPQFVCIVCVCMSITTTTSSHHSKPGGTLRPAESRHKCMQFSVLVFVLTPAPLNASMLSSHHTHHTTNTQIHHQVVNLSGHHKHTAVQSLFASTQCLLNHNLYTHTHTHTHRHCKPDHR